MALLINGQFIDDSLIEQEFGSIKAHFESLGNVSCCERDEEFRGYARDNIIARVLLTQQAEQTIDLPSDSDIDAYLQTMIEEHGSEEQFYAAMGIGTEQMDDLRQNIAQHLQVEKLVAMTGDHADSPTDAQLREYYESNIDQFKSIEEVEASHILKAPQKSEDREPAYQELRQVRQQLLDGGDFVALAKEHSDKGEDETDLGYFQRGELMEEFERVAFSMNVDEISPVFVSPFGFHLIKLTGYKPAEPLPFDEVREEALELFQAERSEEKVRALVEELKKSAVIEDVADEDSDEEEDERHSAFGRDDD